MEELFILKSELVFEMTDLEFMNFANRILFKVLYIKSNYKTSLSDQSILTQSLQEFIEMETYAELFLKDKMICRKSIITDIRKLLVKL